MDAYPLNLILAVATASASIFIGFLPTKTISSTFFARESAKFIFAWVLVALSSPAKIVHYPCIFAFLCFAAWWHFRRDNALTGKMWLSMASGLGISVGVMFILAVTPRAYPAGLPPLSEGLLLASIYLGGAVIGLAYVCFTFIQSTKNNSGVTQGVIQRYVGLLLWLTTARAAVLMIELFLPGISVSDRVFNWDGQWPFGAPHNLYISNLSAGRILLLPMLVLIVLAFFAQRAAGFSSRTQPTRILLTIILVGFLTEILARIFVL